MIYEINLYDTDSRLIYQKKDEADIDSDGILLLDDISKKMTGDELYFLYLRLADSNGNQLDRNFYWLNPKKDILDWDKTEWYYTPTKKYADYSAIKLLPDSDIGYEFRKIRDYEYEVTLENKGDKIAFFKRITLADELTGEEVKPVLYEDNFISLVPRERLTVRIKVFDIVNNPVLIVGSRF